MITRYQSTWNIWSTCTNTYCYQLKYFLFCLDLHYLQLDMICFSQALQYFPVIILRLQGWDRVAAKVVTLIGMKKRWAGSDLAQGARLTLLSVMDLSTTAEGGLGCTAHHAGFHLLTFKPKHGRHVTWEKSKYTKTLSHTQSIGTKIGVVTHNLWHVKIAKKDIARDSGIWFIQLHRVWLWIKIIIFCIQWSSVVIDRVLSKCPSD